MWRTDTYWFAVAIATTLGDRPEGVGADEDSQYHTIAAHLPEVSREQRIRNFSDAHRTSMLSHVHAGDVKATRSVAPDWRPECAMRAVIVDGATLRRERQPGMGAAPCAENGVPG